MATPSISTSTILPWDERGGKYSPVPCTRDSAHKTFGLTDLTSTYSVFTRRVFGASGIEPWPSGLESDALTTRLPTAYVFCLALI
ncbi:hypothetical protein TNCV_2147631 [Trichonephila clavipes]|uniref:Uncharacterized protein n=1 Tax=Trichonephila clavipes TaxID=2585209 RepID=A0A8X6SZ62_TRICX|nr:hypothetical protein TNCV_2147631 [Trichonephila clavipes]